MQFGTATLRKMKNYRVRVSRKAWTDIEDLADFLLTVKDFESARRYLDTMMAEVQSLALFADLYRISTMTDILKYHLKARRMASHNRRWVYIFHIEDDTVIVDRIRPSKIIAK